MKKKRPFGKNTNDFLTVLNLIKCLKQIKLLRLLLRAHAISELPSNLSTMRKKHGVMLENNRLLLKRSVGFKKIRAIQKHVQMKKTYMFKDL